MQHSEHTNEHSHEEHGTLTRSKIWQVFGILLLITVIEFIIALVIIPKGMMPQKVGNYVYIILTLVKAFYIIAYFMHLKFERKILQLTLGLSFFFIIYFIVLMLTEGGYLYEHLNR